MEFVEASIRATLCVSAMLVLVGCSRRAAAPAPERTGLDHVPIVRGLKPLGTQGDLQTGQWDTFMVRGTREELGRVLESEGWKGSGDRLVGRYEKRPTPRPYSAMAVMITFVLTDDVNYQPNEEWSSVIVMRRMGPGPSAAEVAKQKTEAKEMKAISDRIGTIQDDIRDNHVFTDADRAYVLKVIESPRSFDKLRGLMVLVLAEVSGLYPRAELRKVAEKQTCLSTGRVAATMAGMSRFELGPPSDVEISSRANRWSEEWKDERILTLSERTVLTQVYFGARPENRPYAGFVFVQKRSLDKESRKWVDVRIAQEIASSKGDVLEWWRFVKRVVANKNRAK